MLPRTIDNEYHGHHAALWVLGVLLLLKAIMSVNSIFNGFDVARNADGIPLDSYPAAASQTIVALFAIFGLGHLLFTVMGAVALARFRSLVPFFFALFLAEHLIRRVILRLIPIERTGNPPATIVNMALLAVMIIGLALSLWKPAVKAVAAIACMITLPMAAQPGDAEALPQLGRAAMTRGEPSKTIEHFEKAVALKPDESSRGAASLKINPNQRDVAEAGKRVAGAASGS